MIHPNVIIYSTVAETLKNNKSDWIIKQPVLRPKNDQDMGMIDHIRNQYLPNEISNKSQSAYKDDITLMVKLLGSYCQPGVINKIFESVQEIHSTLGKKAPSDVKNWVRILTGLHPQIDSKLKTLAYWQTPYSEVIGTNTIIYYPGTESIDITKWGTRPYYKTNEVKWRPTPWTHPHYIRESVRQKLDPDDVVAYIQNAGLSTTKYLRRNLIWEALISTDSNINGMEYGVRRPIKPKPPEINHGVSLNNDWYHQHYRIMTHCKPIARDNAIAHLDSGGVKRSYLVNHLTPLKNTHIAQRTANALKRPLGVEETFPFKSKNIVIYTDNSPQPVIKKVKKVNNDVLIPEIINGK